jgi:hypothetical protein
MAFLAADRPKLAYDGVLNYIKKNLDGRNFEDLG